MKNKLILIFVVLISIISMFIISNKIFEENNKVVISATEIEKNKSISNINIIAVYKENDKGVYEKQEDGSIPQEGYTIDSEKSVCSNNATPSWNKDTKSLIIDNLTKSGTSCYLYYKIYLTPSEETLVQLNLKESEGCPSVDENGNATINTLATSEDLLCKAQDDYGDTYYFRGAPTHNWVQIGTTYWQIIRINGDGTIRLIYNGTTTTRTGDGTLVRTGKAYNSTANDNKYVGYVYGPKGTTASKNYEEATTNLVKSTILGELEGWYTKDETGQELKKYAQYLDGATGFCNDRQINAGHPSVWWARDTATGFGSDNTAYAPWSRFIRSGEGYKTLEEGVTPTFKCGNPARDLFTTNTEEEIGNGALTIEGVDIPIGLITADEVVYAGGYPGQPNSGYYLYNNRYYWSMSPYYFGGTYAFVFIVGDNGRLIGTNVNDAHGVRPVINLKANTPFSEGNGSSDEPFVVATT